jgi:hypothetical protein
MRLDSANLNRREIFLKFSAIVVATMLVFSSTAMIGFSDTESPCITTETDSVKILPQRQPIQVNSILTEEGTWFSFDSSSNGTPAQIHVTVSDTSGITIVADFYGFWRRDYVLNSTTSYDELEIPGTSSMHEIGRPMLPRLTEFVEIPHDIDVSLDILSTTSVNFSGYEIAPTQSPESPVWYKDWNVTAEPPTPLFDDLYSYNSFFPDHEASMEGGTNATSMIMRGRRLLELSLYPIQYNPVTGMLKAFSQIIVKVKYNQPAQIEPIVEELHSEVFESIFEQTILNFKCIPKIYERWDELGAGYPVVYHPPFPPISKQAEYLIITHVDFKDEAFRLAEWKRQKGLLTVVEVIPDGAAASQIAYIIKNAYNNWYPRPTYVLLFGDCEFIPTNYPMVHEGKFYGAPMYDANGYIGSDLPYFAIDGDDYFPDMIYSRISVDTQEQAKTVVDKILIYEKFPPAGPDFFNDILSAAFFEDSVIDPISRQWVWDGKEQEQMQYVYYAEGIRHYLDSLGYDVHVNYSAEYSIDLPAFRPLKYSNDEDLCDHLLDEDFIWLEAWEGDEYYSMEAGNITANINDGRFLVYHFDHGGSKNMVYLEGNRDEREGWQHPNFNITDLPYLTNGNYTPLIISISCNTGWFDGERDQVEMGTRFEDYGGESLSENITRMEGGAIAVIAASRHDYNIAGGDMLNGIIQSFWPGYLGYRNPPIYEMGAALLLGKMHVAKEWRYKDQSPEHPEQVANTTFQIFHLFGDPETQLWTDTPSSMSVEHPDQIGIGPQRFVVTVTDNATPVSYAKVCLQKGTDVYQVGYTNTNGQVIFDVHPSYAGKMNITVTKHNFVPYIGEMECVCSSATIFVSPDTGPTDTSIELSAHGFIDNDVISIYFESSLVATMSTGTTTVTRTPSGRTGFVNVIAKGSVSGLVAITIFTRQSDDPRPDPYIYSQWDPSTWEVTDGSIVWYNPDITIYLSIYPVTLFGGVHQNIEYDVHVTVHNQGDITATDTDVVLSYAPIGGGVSWTYIGEDTITIPVDETREAIIPWQPSLPGLFCLKAEISHENDKNFDNNIGYEGFDIIALDSPGETEFLVGNPTDAENYVFINVRQLGNYTDVWNASILNYSSQVINTGNNESVTLLIDPGFDLEIGESRLFTAEVHVNCELVGGVVFKATKLETPSTITPPPVDPLIIIIIGSAIVVVAVATIVYVKRK